MLRSESYALFQLPGPGVSLAPDGAISPGSESGRRRGKRSSLMGERRVHRTEKQVQVQDSQDLSQWLSTLGRVAVSGDVSGYHDGGAPDIYGHEGMLFNFSNAHDSPPCQRTVQPQMSVGSRLANPALSTYLLEEAFSFYFLSPRPFHHGCIRQQGNNRGI